MYMFVYVCVPLCVYLSVPIMWFKTLGLPHPFHFFPVILRQSLLTRFILSISVHKGFYCEHQFYIADVHPFFFHAEFEEIKPCVCLAWMKGCTEGSNLLTLFTNYFLQLKWQWKSGKSQLFVTILKNKSRNPNPVANEYYEGWDNPCLSKHFWDI